MPRLDAIAVSLLDQAARLWRNPVLRRESRSRLRGTRTLVILTGFMTALSLTFYVAYHVILSQYSWRPWALSKAGAQLFCVLAGVECGLIMLLAPAFSCATVTTERERGTLDLVHITLLSPRTILVGKLAASLSYILMLLFSSLPIFSACLLLGGLSPLQIVLAVLILAATTVTYGLLGLFFSVMAGKTVTAAALSTLAVFGLNLMPIALVGIMDMLLDLHGDNLYKAALCSSPIPGLVEILIPEFRLGIVNSLGVPAAAITWPGYFLLALVLWSLMVRRVRRTS
ncbi:MAG: hypothetical protein HYU36_13670 [Planctomycetes bacterium]|nr:hypothetical protein [Planctomycetota bacterium]